MTFLDLCQRVAQEGDLGTISTVAGQTGEAGRVVRWVKNAYRDICRRHPNWNYLRSSFTVNTVADQRPYVVTACTDNDALSATMTVAGFRDWWTDTFRIYLQSAGVAGEGFLPFTDYQSFRNQWMRGTQTSQQPNEFTVRPRDKAILLGPAPNAVYVLTGEYQRHAPDLAQDEDEPLFNDCFHELIVWWAIVFYGGFEADAGLYTHANNEKNRILGELELDQLPEVCIGGALA
jgi:hypothetical protein